MPNVMDERVAAIIAYRRKPRVKRFPPLECDIGIAMLSDSEVDAAKLAAQKYITEVKANLDIDPEFLEREKQRQVVWRAIVDPTTVEETPPKPFFPSYRDVRDLDAALVNALWWAWSDTQEEMAPVTRIPEGELDLLVDAMSKGSGREEVLTLFAPDTLRALVRSLALRLSTSQTPKSSGT